MQKICPLHYLDVISFMPSHCIDYDHNAALHALYCRFLVATDTQNPLPDQFNVKIEKCAEVTRIANVDPNTLKTNHSLRPALQNPHSNGCTSRGLCLPSTYESSLDAYRHTTR